MLKISESHSSKYSPRTYHNAKTSDVTLAFAVDMNTAGEKLTKKAAGDSYLGIHFDKTTDRIQVARDIYKFVRNKNAKVLNIAGNGIYTLTKHGIDQDWINQFIYDVLKLVSKHLIITKINSGCQTGVDLAGLVTGVKLGIDSEGTLPKGFIMRFQDGQDVSMNRSGIMFMIDEQASKLKEEL